MRQNRTYGWQGKPLRHERRALGTDTPVKRERIATGLKIVPTAPAPTPEPIRRPYAVPAKLKPVAVLSAAQKALRCSRQQKYNRTFGARQRLFFNGRELNLEVGKAVLLEFKNANVMQHFRQTMYMINCYQDEAYRSRTVAENALMISRVA